ncbi:MAG: hypothetical protein IPN79_04295 [Saprospiraceae bacterium]|nr:hypothetical protein [Saprospiraceae bacterium]
MITGFALLHPTSRVWIFQAENELSQQQEAACDLYIKRFLDSWTSHNQDIMSYGGVYHHRFLVFLVDQTQTSASGCSQDKLMHFVEDLEKHFGISFLGRTQVAYRNTKDENIKVMPLENLKEAYHSGTIQDETLFFDNLVDTKLKFENSWEKPLKESWHKRFI